MILFFLLCSLCPKAHFVLTLGYSGSPYGLRHHRLPLIPDVRCMYSHVRVPREHQNNDRMRREWRLNLHRLEIQA